MLHTSPTISLGGRLQTLSLQVEQLQSENASFESTITSLRADLEVEKQNSRLLREEVVKERAKELVIEESTREYVRLRDEHEALVGEANAMRGMLDQQATVLARCTEQLALFKDEMLAQRQELDEVYAALEAEQDAKAGLEVRCKDLARECRISKQALRSKSDSVASLMREKNLLHAKLVGADKRKKFGSAGPADVDKENVKEVARSTRERQVPHEIREEEAPIGIWVLLFDGTKGLLVRGVGHTSCRTSRAELARLVQCGGEQMHAVPRSIAQPTDGVGHALQHQRWNHCMPRIDQALILG